MATAGSIVVDLLMRTGSFETDTKRAERQMRQLQRRVDQTVRRIGMYGLAVAGTFAAAMKSANNYMAEIGTAAERTSVSAQSFSELAYAAEQASLSQGELERILRRSTEAINHGIKGGSKQAEALKKLGISAYDAAGKVKTADQMLKDMAEKFSQLEPGAQKTGLVIDLFGMQLGQKVIPLLNLGADGLDEMAKKARELGIVIDDKAAQAAIDFESNLVDLKKAGQGLAISLAKDMIPWLTEMIEQFRLGIQYSDGFFDALMRYGTASPYKSAEEHLRRVKGEIEELDRLIGEIRGGDRDYLDVVLGGGTSELQIKELEKKRRRLLQEVGYWGEMAKREFDENFVGPRLPTRRMKTIDITPSDNKKTARTSSRIDEGQRYIQQLHERIALLGKETEYERLLAQMSVGAIKFREDADRRRALGLAQMMDEMQHAQRAAEEYQSLMHRLYPERQAADNLAEQLDALRWAFDEGALAAEGYSEAMARLIDSSLELMPEIQGLSVHISGGDAEFERLEREEERVNKWYEEQLARLNEFRKQKAELNEEWDEREREITEQKEAAIDSIERARSAARLASTEAMFGELSGLAMSFAGEQSGIYRALFAVEKAYALAKVMLNAPKTASDAYDAVVGIPVVGPALAPVAAAAAMAYQMAQASSVQSIGITGMAHDGIDSIPKTGTWLLEKGERVVTSETSARLDSVLRRIEANRLNSLVKQPAGVTVNLIESDTRAGEVESKTSDDGEQELNIFVADIRGGGKRSQVLEATYGLTRIGR